MTYVSMVSFIKGEGEHAYFIRHFTQVLHLLILNSKAYIESYQESSLPKETTFKSIYPFYGNLGFP